MFQHDLFEVLLGYFLTKLGHRRLDIIRCDVTVSLGIELFKHSDQPLISENLFDRDRGREKLCVIYLVAAVVVNFPYYAIYLFLVLLVITKMKSLAQIRHGDVAGLLLIYLGEGSSQNFNILRISSHLYKNI